MITTRQVNVDLTKGKLKLRHVSTKDINAGVKIEPPKAPIKARGVSTTTLPDVADIKEKKRRDDIAKEKKKATITKPVGEIKLDIKDVKKLVMAEKKPESKVEIITVPAIIKDGEGESAPTITEKKPWKEMTDEEKKVEYKERAKRAAATRAAKKK